LSKCKKTRGTVFKKRAALLLKGKAVTSLFQKNNGRKKEEGGRQVEIGQRGAGFGRKRGPARRRRKRFGGILGGGERRRKIREKDDFGEGLPSSRRPLYS